MRKLASVQKISALKPIEGADKICAYQVGGWWVVGQVNEYKVGDLAIYVEVDSWIPHELAPFLSKGKEPREYLGVKGEKLRTIRLKKQLSQGLLLPLSIRGQYFESTTVGEFEGIDVTNDLHIQKWEPPINPQMAGQIKGSFPSNIQKTDAERIQNLKSEVAEWFDTGHLWEVSEKLEGTSATFALTDDGEFLVCSRNINLKEDETNLYWKIAKKYDIESKMREHNMLGMTIQGEIIGNGIQGNIYNLPDNQFKVFTIQYNGEQLLPIVRQHFVNRLGLENVPIISTSFQLFTKDIDELLNFADGNSHLANTLREGIVLKSMSIDGLMFKIVSNKYLLGEK